MPPRPSKKSDSSTERSGIRLRPRLLVSMVLLIALGMAARVAWEQVRSGLAGSDRYQLSAETIRILPETPPAWLRSDIKGEVLRDSDLAHTLSLLDDPAVVQQRLVDAFEIHPWVHSVERVEIVGPSQIHVVLQYREPVAVVEVASPEGTDRFLVDTEATRLPDGDLTEIERSYLPLITSAQGRPMVGEPWTDLRVIGAVRLAAALRQVWEQYRLHEIIPSPHPEVQRSQRYFVYDIRSSGGTIVRWGAAPDLGPSEESSFKDKLDRLAGYIRQYGPLDSIDGPKLIDVRSQLYVEKWTLQHGIADEEIAR